MSEIIDLNQKEINAINRLFGYLRPKTPVGSKLQDLIDALQAEMEVEEVVIEEGSPVNAVNANETLTLDGVVVDGETVSVGNDIYEFVTDDALSLSEGTIVVDITSSATKATNNLTVDTIPTADDDSMVIGGKTYTFVATDTAVTDGEINIGATLEDTQANIVAAINGTDLINTANEYVTCGTFADNIAAITALIGGTAGNLIGTISVFTAGTNLFSDVTLGTGTDCVAADAVTALVAAITASDTQGVSAATGEGTTVVLTADVAGVDANDIVIGESLANGSFTDDATTLSGGIDGTVGEYKDVRADDSYLYMAIADNTIVDKNWRRIAFEVF